MCTRSPGPRPGWPVRCSRRAATAEAAAAGLEAEAYASRHGLGARWAPVALISTAGALFQLGRWDEAAEALTRAQRYELHGLYELAGRSAAPADGGGPRPVRDWPTGGPRACGSWLRDSRPGGLPLSPSSPSGRTIRSPPARPSSASIAHPDTPVACPRLGVRLRDHGGGGPRGPRAVAACRGRHSRNRAPAALPYLARMRAVFEDVATRLPYFRPWVAAQLATCEAEFSRLEGTPDPDRWAAAAAAWEALQIPYEAGYALMREAEATLAQHRRPAEGCSRPERCDAPSLPASARCPSDGRPRALAARARDPARAGCTVRSVLRAARPRNWTRENSRPDPSRWAGRAGARWPARPDTREREVLALVGAGRSNGEIGEILYVSKKTVSVHVANIKAKLGASSRVEIAVYAIELGLVEGRRLLRAAAIRDASTLPRTLSGSSGRRCSATMTRSD